MVSSRGILFIAAIISIITFVVFFVYNVEQDREEFCESMNMVYKLKPADARCIDYINDESYHIIEIEGKMYLEERLLNCYNDANEVDDE